MKAYLEPVEVEKLEEAAEYLRDKLLIRLLFRLGCRVSEALAVAEDDIDLERSTVTIEHLKVRLKLSCPQCGTRLSRTGKFCPGCAARVEKTISEETEHHRKRTLPVDGDTRQMLQDYVRNGGSVKGQWPASSLRHQPAPGLAHRPGVRQSRQAGLPG